MRHFPSIAAALLILALIGGCAPSAPSGSATQPAPPNGDINASGSAATGLLRIRLATTSDWTNLALASGASWQDAALVSASQEAASAVLDGDRFALEQPIGRAEAGESVEMIVEARGAGWQAGKMVVFRIERGDIGSTHLEFLRPAGASWEVIRTIDWEGKSGDGRNDYTFSVSAEALFGAPSLPTATPASIAGPGPEPAPVSSPMRPVSPVTGLPQGTDGYPWWNDSVFYEIFVRSFFDSSGDGIGDLNGITQKLDYLNDGDPATTTDLGITGIWLMPIFPSPSYHGYDVTDYYAVNPEYGTMEDLKTLLAEAHGRGIRVIIDLVLNHTSSRHPWFEQARHPASPYHDWYVWSDTDPGYPGPWGQPVWWPLDGRYYYGMFVAGMPDLNYTNPAVTAEMQDVVRFWLEEVGVDGFRLDAAKHLIEEGSIQAHTAATHAWWAGLRPVYKQANPQAVTVGELWDSIETSVEYVQGDELDLAFEFTLAGAFLQSARDGNAAAANSQLRLVSAVYPPLQYAPFLTNHDQVRVMTELRDAVEKAKVAASMLLTAPGVPFLYYGEEVGMQGEKPDEWIRRPMQWSGGDFAGFSTVAPWQSAGPGWERYNAALEAGDPASLLSHYRSLIQARNQHAALRVGDVSVITSGNRALYSVLRVSHQEAVIVLVNLSGETITGYRLSLEESGLPEGRHVPAAILGEGALDVLTVSPKGGFSQYVPVPAVPPYSTYIFQVPLVAGSP